jgi:hypothetical protein
LSSITSVGVCLCVATEAGRDDIVDVSAAALLATGLECPHSLLAVEGARTVSEEHG